MRTPYERTDSVTQNKQALGADKPMRTIVTMEILTCRQCRYFRTDAKFPSNWVCRAWENSAIWKVGGIVEKMAIILRWCKGYNKSRKA